MTSHPVTIGVFLLLFVLVTCIGMLGARWRAGAWTLDFKNSIYSLELFGWTIPCYAAVSAVVLNIGASLILSWVLDAISKGPRVDETAAEDYIL